MHVFCWYSFAARPLQIVLTFHSYFVMVTTGENLGTERIYDQAERFVFFKVRGFTIRLASPFLLSWLSFEKYFHYFHNCSTKNSEYCRLLGKVMMRTFQWMFWGYGNGARASLVEILTNMDGQELQSYVLQFPWERHTKLRHFRPCHIHELCNGVLAGVSSVNANRTCATQCRTGINVYRCWTKSKMKKPILLAYIGHLRTNGKT